MTERTLRILRVVSAGVVAAIVIVPATALAWGPLAHLHFSAQALARAGSAGSPLHSLLQQFANEFLYGSLAADIVVGKNLARYAHHCHNWANGFRVLAAARSHAERAFGWGFLAHLAADTVAHNYYVPFQKIVSHRAPRTRHAYWELRYDQRMDPELSRLAREVTRRRYRGHDALLRRELRSGCVLPFTLSRGLFSSVLASARAPRFQSFSRLALARHRSLPLEDELLAETNALAVDAIAGLLLEGERARVVRVDPTGGLPLGVAGLLRRRLASHGMRAEASDLALETRASFRRAASHGALVLPARAARLAA
jgi:hypothetical protein